MPRRNGRRIGILTAQRGNVKAAFCCDCQVSGLARPLGVPRAGQDDYPRVCGGNDIALRAWWLPMGLSPRVRGKHHGRRRFRVYLRAIPACAGETANRQPGYRQPVCYPRVCGGNRVRLGYRYQNGGLSPRVRGKQITSGPEAEPLWAIPACAGETAILAPSFRSGTSYPRVCGGNRVRLGYRYQNGGLSRVCGGNTAHARATPRTIT